MSYNLCQSSSVLPKTPSLTSSARGTQPAGTKVILTCKTTSPETATYTFYKNNNTKEIPNAGSSGSYVVPATAGQNSFTCKAIISGVTSAASSSVSLNFVGE